MDDHAPWMKKQQIADAVYDALMEICGGGTGGGEKGKERENNKEKRSNLLWREELRDIAVKSVSFPHKSKKHENKKHSSSSSTVKKKSQIAHLGKSHDVEIRAALALFHRYKTVQYFTTHYNHETAELGTVSSIPSSSPAAKTGPSSMSLKVISDFGLSRYFSSPYEFSQLLCVKLEEVCQEKNLENYYIQSCPAGIICVVTPFRNMALRQLGRLPCPQCPQWCKGEKGLWWHQQQQHGCKHSDATVSAASQCDSLAIVSYSNGDDGCCSIGNNQDTSQARSDSYLNPGNKISNAVTIMKTPSTAEGLRLSPVSPITIDDGLEFVKKGDLQKVKHMIQNGHYNPLEERKCKNKRKGSSGCSPLLWAAGCGHLHIVRYLIEECDYSPHDDKQYGKRAFAGRTALHWASRNGHLPIVKYLVDECHMDIDAATIDGTTAFCWACWQSHSHVMKFLHERGCNVNVVNSFGCNAILWCAQGTNFGAGGDVQTIKWLQFIGCDVELINSNKHGVLHKAAQRGRRDICEWLVQSVLLRKILSQETKKEARQKRNTNIEMEEDNNKNGTGSHNNGDTKKREQSDLLLSLLDLIGPDCDGCCPSGLAGMEGHEELAIWLASQEVNIVQKIKVTMEQYHDGIYKSKAISSLTPKTRATTRATKRANSNSGQPVDIIVRWITSCSTTGTIKPSSVQVQVKDQPLWAFRSDEYSWEAWGGVSRISASLRIATHCMRKPNAKGEDGID